MNLVLNYLADNWRRLGLDVYGPASRLSCVLATPRASIASRHVIFLVFRQEAARPVVVAKLPRVQGDNSHLDREACNLRMLAQAAHHCGFNCIPQLIAAEQTNPGTLLLETALHGTRLERGYLRRHFQQSVQAVLAWLLEFHHATLDPRGCDYAALLEAPLERFTATFPLLPEEEQLIKRSLEISSALRHAWTPAVFEHGDLCDPNLLIANGRARILDWETGTARCFPAGDLFMFLSYAAFAHGGYKDAELVAAFESTFFPAPEWVRRIIARYVSAIGIDADLLTALFVAYWTRYLVTYAERASGGLKITDGAAAHVREERGYQLWRHALRNVHRLRWGALCH